MNADVVQSRTALEIEKPMRADARRNLGTILKAALAVFDRLGVDAPIRTIAAEAGVGVGTIYRHFPQRSDLIKAIIEREVDDCADAARILSQGNTPIEALSLWVEGLVDFAGTKRGLGPALHSGDATYEALPFYVLGRLTPAITTLLNAAEASADIGPGTEPAEFLNAAMRLASAASAGQPDEARRMLALLVDGLRYRAKTNPDFHSGEL